MEMDLNRIQDREVRVFAQRFFANRAVNREFYEGVSEKELDYRIVETSDRKSDSPRESLAHQIYVTRKYICGVKSGVLAFDGLTEKPLLKRPEDMTKEELLVELGEADQELLALLSDPEVAGRQVKVPWSNDPIPAIQSLAGLESHEVLHTGWNLAVMDHLGMGRGPKLKEMWG